ncbi:MAG: hypothetical protein KDE27_24305 [Planctomycetes bacterium]|nr:hypothetical protein [Planctomycetota bacterium]
MLTDVQQLLARACWQREPIEWLRATLRDAAPARLTAAEQAMLLALDGDGLRVTRLLLQKLRLERLLRADAAAAAALASDEAGFVERFRRYCDAVPPTAVFPSEEAALFAAFARSDTGS